MKGLSNQLRHGKAMLTPLLLSAVLFSCSKEDLQEPSSEIEGVETQLSTVGATYSSANLLFEETFEGSDPWSGYDLKERFAGSHTFNQVSSPVFSGSKSGRFELRNTDELSSGTRAEVRFPEITSTSQLHRWYSFSLYLPSADYKKDSEDEVLNQWHQGSGYSPSISLRTKDDRFWLYVKPTTSTTQKIDLGAIPKDKWNTFVYHIKHSSGSDGILELWINGKKVVDRAGANMYKVGGDIEYPRFNIGIYKSAWNGSNTSETSKRVLYYDQFRLGSEKATYAEMTSGKSVPTEPAPTDPVTTTPPASSTPPTGSSITGFTLVSAHTEKDVMSIANGATISLAKIGEAKLNIRANTASSLTSVKFELSGAQSKTYTDKAAPFALHGDSNGNYYYGNWAPPALGTYTLKATPYSGSTAGTPYTIKFTITK